LLAGESTIAPVTGFGVREHPCQIASQLHKIPCPPDLLDPAGVAPMPNGQAGGFEALPRLEKLLLWCCSAGLRDADLWERRQELRIGLVVGMGAEWLSVWEADGLAGGNRIWEPGRDATALVNRICHGLHLSGPAASVSAACASGNYALMQARHWLDMGWVDVCLAGACDLGVTPMCLAAFGNLRALSRRNAEPQAASRPFDKQRDGFVMGEGGALFVLEPEASARRRGARVYSEVAGFGASSDAHNMVIPSPDPEPAAQAMRQALRDARVDAAEVDYINAHATSTPVGDIAETRVLGSVFGEVVRKVPVSSTKSMTGHMLTAAAAIEALACIVAMQRKALPPTINLDDPDPECNLLHVANHAWERPVRVAVSNSFGFGGSNTCLVLKAV